MFAPVCPAAAVAPGPMMVVATPSELTRAYGRSAAGRQDRQTFRKANLPRVDRTAIGQHLDACLERIAQGLGEAWVEVGGGGDAVAVGTLDDEQGHRPVPGRHPGGQFPQVPGGAGRNTVRKLRQTRLPHQVDVLIMFIIHDA